MYFSLRNGSLMDDQEVRRVASALGLHLKDDKAVRGFALGLPGVAYCVEHPSVKYLVTQGRLPDAVRLYYNTHKAQGMTLTDARNRVLALQREWSVGSQRMTAKAFADSLTPEDRNQLIAGMRQRFCEEGKTLEQAAEELGVTEGLARHLLQLWEEDHLSA